MRLPWAMDWGYSDKRLINNVFAAGAVAMTHEDFIIDRLCRVDRRVPDLPKHPQAALWPSERVMSFLRGVSILMCQR